MGYLKSSIKMSITGVNGELYVYEDKVIIERGSVLGFLTAGLTGSKTIPMSSIMSVQFKEGTSLTNGYIQLGVLGGKEKTGGLVAATRDENTVIIKKTDNAIARKITDYIENIIMERDKNKEPVMQQISAADEIRKFKILLDQEIITQSEFDAKKKQLLGL